MAENCLLQFPLNPSQRPHLYGIYNDAYQWVGLLVSINVKNLLHSKETYLAQIFTKIKFFTFFLFLFEIKFDFSINFLYNINRKWKEKIIWKYNITISIYRDIYNFIYFLLFHFSKEAKPVWSTGLKSKPCCSARFVLPYFLYIKFEICCLLKKV